MPAVVSQGVNGLYIWLGIFASIFAICLGVWALLRPIRKYFKQQHLEDERIHSRVRVHDRILLGERASYDNPDPSPGLMAQVSALHRRFTPNGGASKDPGDLLLRIARAVGVPVNTLTDPTQATAADAPVDMPDFEEGAEVPDVSPGLLPRPRHEES